MSAPVQESIPVSSSPSADRPKSPSITEDVRPDLDPNPDTDMPQGADLLEQAVKETFETDDVTMKPASDPVKPSMVLHLASIPSRFGITVPAASSSTGKSVSVGDDLHERTQLDTSTASPLADQLMPEESYMANVGTVFRRVRDLQKREVTTTQIFRKATPDFYRPYPPRVPYHHLAIHELSGQIDQMSRHRTGFMTNPCFPAPGLISNTSRSTDVTMPSSIPTTVPVVTQPSSISTITTAVTVPSTISTTVASAAGASPHVISDTRSQSPLPDAPPPKKARTVDDASNAPRSQEQRVMDVDQPSSPSSDQAATPEKPSQPSIPTFDPMTMFQQMTDALTSQRLEYQTQIADLKKDHQARIEELRLSHHNDLVDMREKCERSLVYQKNAKKTEICTYTLAIQALQEHVKRLEAENDRLRTAFRSHHEKVQAMAQECSSFMEIDPVRAPPSLIDPLTPEKSFPAQPPTIPPPPPAPMPSTQEASTSEESSLAATFKQKGYPSTCPVCNETFDSITKRDRHAAKKHPGDKIYKCTFPGCDSKYTTPSSLQKHVSVKHTKTTYPCEHDGCTYVATSRQNLSEHTPLHTDRFRCFYCQDEKRHCHGRNLERHLMKVHKLTFKKTRTCPFCEKFFAQFDKLNEHLAQLHFANKKVPDDEEFQVMHNFLNPDPSSDHSSNSPNRPITRNRPTDV